MALYWIIKYTIVFELCLIGLHSLNRIVAPSLLTGVLLEELFSGDINESAYLLVLASILSVAVFILSDILAWRAAQRDSVTLRKVALALPLGFFVITLPFFLPQLIFTIGYDARALLTLFVPIGLGTGLFAWKKIPATWLIPIVMFTIGLNFSLYLKGNRGVTTANLLEIVDQEYLRPLILTPSELSEDLSQYHVLPGMDVQDILLHSSGEYLLAAAGNNFEPPYDEEVCPLVRIHLDDGRIDTIPISTGLRPMAIDQKRNRLYVGTDFTEAKIVVVDLETFEEIARKDALIQGDMAALELFLFVPEEDVLWVFHEWDIIEKWSVDPLERVGIFPGHGMHEYFYDEETERVYFQSECVPPGLMVMTLDNGPELVDLRMFPVSYGLCWVPELGGILATDPFLGRVWIFDPDSLDIVDSFSAGIGSKNIAWDEPRGLIYIGNYLDGHLHIHDAQTKDEVASINVGQRFRRLLVSPKTGDVFVNTSRGVFQVDVDGLVADARDTGSHP